MTLIYTINLDGYDTPKPAFSCPDSTYLAITDNPHSYKALGWDHVLPLEVPRTADGWPTVNPRRVSRNLKINSHKLPKELLDAHEFTIYIDACLTPVRSLHPLVSYIGGNDIAIPPHPGDICAYKHAERCEILGLERAEALNKQVESYRKQGFPEDFGLTENCIIIRRNTPQIKKLNQEWWKQYTKGGARDQIALPFASWKTGVDIIKLPIHPRQNEYYTGWGQHTLNKR